MSHIPNKCIYKYIYTNNSLVPRNPITLYAVIETSGTDSQEDEIHCSSRHPQIDHPSRERQLVPYKIWLPNGWMLCAWLFPSMLEVWDSTATCSPAGFGIVSERVGVCPSTSIIQRNFGHINGFKSPEWNYIEIYSPENWHGILKKRPPIQKETHLPNHQWSWVPYP